MPVEIGIRENVWKNLVALILMPIVILVWISVTMAIWDYLNNQPSWTNWMIVIFTIVVAAILEVITIVYVRSSKE